ncbi:sensor histidine kinase [Pseudonocardia nigra]|uniref:sensor histidine kinase n=1 Tax=Pseudonocardia nigra TaxID=1921578 RepID=UPI0027E376DC|nr:HAMP domain-containing sensor histidine kinase [Pseudonocardia nigra]
MPARLRIMAWLVLLLFIALVTVVIVTRNLLISEAEQEASASLVQETEEFLQVATAGVDRATDQPYRDGRDLLASHIQRQYTDEDEILLGVTADGEILPQPGREPVALASRDNRLVQIVRDPDSAGILPTRDGRLRWQKVPVVTADGRPDGTFIVAYAIDREIEDINDTITLLAVVSLIGLLIAAGASWVVSGQILAPVNLVRRTAAEITHDDLTERIPVHGRDDVAALSEQFNAMLDRLEQAFGTQRQFLDDASHELRTPITIIRGNLELMEENPAERAEVVRLCTDELDRMSRIVEDLLLLAKSERPDFVRPEPVDLVDLTSDIDAKLRAIGPRRWQLAAIAEGEAVIDAQRVTQAVVQLAQNAVQHTNPGAEIRFGSSIDDGGLSFWISDTGPGVRHEDGPAIFQRFSRGSTGGARAHRTGAGLGLSIVTAIAEAHDGWVELLSVPGEGATFTLRFRNATPAPPLQEETVDA